MLRDMAVDSDGNTYLISLYWTDYIYDTQTLKVDPAGNILWNKTYDLGTDQPGGIAVDKTGNVFVTSGRYIGKIA